MQIYKDIRDITESDLNNFDAVVHLYAVSNDPMGHDSKMQHIQLILRQA